MSHHSFYSFHPIADEQQTDIWLYTYEQWGIHQADEYIEGLHNKLTEVAEDFSLLRTLPAEINSQIKFFHYGSHFVFLKKIDEKHCHEKIQVLTILHDRMDIPHKLHDILQQF